MNSTAFCRNTSTDKLWQMVKKHCIDHIIFSYIFCKVPWSINHQKVSKVF